MPGTLPARLVPASTGPSRRSSALAGPQRRLASRGLPRPCLTSSRILHGYYRDANGALHFPIDPPGSTPTVLFGPNDRNWVVGRYAESSDVTHGLFFVPTNNFFTFDYPGSSFTSLNGINAQGFICGRYLDASNIEHGFLARVTGTPPTRAAGTEMKAFASPSRVTPLNPSPSAWGGQEPAR